MNHYSTKQVAVKAGISRATLERWLATGKFSGPRTAQVGLATVRYWTDSDVARVVVYKGRRYRKGRGRKKASQERSIQ
jgi:predicted site-specific integrase-resolvase